MEKIMDVFNCIEAFRSSEGFFVRATIRGHWARKFPKQVLLHDCEYLWMEAHPVHGRRITCFEADLGPGKLLDVIRFREFLRTVERLDIHLPERMVMRNAVPLVEVITSINLTCV